MSVFNFEGGAAEAIQEKITDDVATVILDTAINGTTFVPWFEVNENSGGTPTLTVEIYDGAVSYYLGAGGFTWVAKALTAKQSVRFDQGYVLRFGSQLRVTSNNIAGLVDVVGISILRTPTAAR